MTGMLDTNILVYAVNKDSDCHKKASDFIKTLLESSDPVYLCWPVIYEFLRVTTHPKVFSNPLSWQNAWEYISLIFLSQPNVVVLRESDSHQTILDDLLKSVRKIGGNLFHDCHIAAILRENGVKNIFTHDYDFRLFPFLEVLDPISSQKK
jgi:toxin-antitoxin system PIN domain toxin